jgi:predicted dehydrogenase
VIRTAIVGTGGIARSHAEAVHANGEHVELVAAVDIDRERLAAFRERFGITAGYTDVGVMLEREQPDLVQIATPPALHVDLAIQALEAGAWVLCEKPLCGSLAEVDRLQEAEARTGRYCAVLFQWRFGSAGSHVRRLIESEQLGRPRVAVCNTLWYRDETYYAVPWRGTWATELGGVSTGHAIHIMDLLLYLLGDWAEVHAVMGTLERSIEVEDVLLAMVRFENGALGSIANSVLSPRQESYLRLDFTSATVELTTLYGYGNDNWRFTALDGGTHPWQEIPGSTRAGHPAVLAHVLDCMRQQKRPLTSGHEARRTVEFLTGLYKSAQTKEPVRRAELVPGDGFYAGWSGAARVGGR